MNIFMNLDLEMEKNGILVFLVMVFVNRVFLVLGGLISNIFFGILVFIVVNFLGCFKNFIIFMKFCLVLFIFVIFWNVMFVLGFIWNLVLDFLKVIGFLGLLGFILFWDL